MQLSLHNGSSIGVTIISNIFIDYYMPQANGEFVKIYLYLLRCLNSGQGDLDLASVADVFSCTESDILRTLRYWESRQLVALAGTGSVTSIDFLEPMIPAGASSPISVQFSGMTSDTSAARRNRSSKSAPGKPAKAPVHSSSGDSVDKLSDTVSGKSSGSQNISAGRPAKSVSDFSSDISDSMKEAASSLDRADSKGQKTHLSADRKRELKSNEEVRQMLFIAEQYLGTTLSRTVTDELIYIYDQLHFSVDLIDYLIEYCVSKGSGDIHYIKKVAFNWHEAGIDTVTKAKQETTTYHRNYFTILKAFGITNRNPVASEVNMINHWMKDYGFTMDILTEACTRTVTQTGKANFRYADKILSDWKSKGVRHLTDIQALDTLHRQLQADREEQKSQQKSHTKSGTVSNRFNNFKQRDYNYKELENQLLKQPRNT